MQHFGVRSSPGQPHLASISQVLADCPSLLGRWARAVVGCAGDVFGDFGFLPTPEQKDVCQALLDSGQGLDAAVQETLHGALRWFLAPSGAGAPGPQAAAAPAEALGGLSPGAEPLERQDAFVLDGTPPADHELAMGLDLGGSSVVPAPAPALAPASPPASAPASAGVATPVHESAPARPAPAPVAVTPAEAPAVQVAATSCSDGAAVEPPVSARPDSAVPAAAATPTAAASPLPAAIGEPQKPSFSFKSLFAPAGGSQRPSTQPPAPSATQGCSLAPEGRPQPPSPGGGSDAVRLFPVFSQPTPGPAPGRTIVWESLEPRRQVWQLYDTEQTRALEREFQRNAAGSAPLFIAGGRFNVEFGPMLQRNARGGTRRVRRREVTGAPAPARPPAPASPKPAARRASGTVPISRALLKAERRRSRPPPAVVLDPPVSVPPQGPVLSGCGVPPKPGLAREDDPDETESVSSSSSDESSSSSSDSSSDDDCALLAGPGMQRAPVPVAPAPLSGAPALVSTTPAAVSAARPPAPTPVASAVKRELSARSVAAAAGARAPVDSTRRGPDRKLPTMRQPKPVIKAKEEKTVLWSLTMGQDADMVEYQARYVGWQGAMPDGCTFRPRGAVEEGPGPPAPHLDLQRYGLGLVCSCHLPLLRALW